MQYTAREVHFQAHVFKLRMQSSFSPKEKAPWFGYLIIFKKG